MILEKNITLASLDKISNNGVLDEHKEINVSEEYLKKINIKAPSIFHETGNLSGGGTNKKSCWQDGFTQIQMY